jgi:hypothetical protein
MVFCPMKLASIALMKCGEYQAAHGCGATCAHAVSAAVLEQLRASMIDDGGPRTGTNSFVCNNCGGYKDKRWAKWCAACRTVLAKYRWTRRR